MTDRTTPDTQTPAPVAPLNYLTAVDACRAFGLHMSATGHGDYRISYKPAALANLPRYANLIRADLVALARDSLAYFAADYQDAIDTARMMARDFDKMLEADCAAFDGLLNRVTESGQ